MTPQQLEAVVVGAGFGGIGAAIQLRRLGYDNFVILEREDDLGGTWHVNRYPGLAVDIPSTTYSYWFEPNPNWSRLFAPGAELKRYADDVADKYDVRRNMRFNTAVESARWDEDGQSWHIALAGGETLTSRFLITATGFLSQPHVPDIPGITEFTGRTIHTTAWDDDYDFDGRRVGLIGTGATAVQLVPELAKRVADMTVYQRTPIYVVPKLDFPITGPLRRLFGRVPPSQRVFRWVTDNILELMLVSAVLHYRQSRPLNFAAAALSKVHQFASVRDRELRRKLTPDYDFGCKRPTSPTPTIARSPSRTFIWRPRASHASNRTASSLLPATRRRWTPWCWPPVSTCGMPTSLPSRSSAARDATSVSGGGRTGSRPIREYLCRPSRTT